MRQSASWLAHLSWVLMGGFLRQGPVGSSMRWKELVSLTVTDSRLQTISLCLAPDYRVSLRTSHALDGERRKTRHVCGAEIGPDPDMRGRARGQRIRESPRHHRHRRPHGTLKGSREVVFAITDLNAHQFSPAELAVHSRGHWTMEDPVHHPRAVSIKEDARRTRTRNAPVVL